MALIYIVEDDDNIREIETIALKNSNYMVKDFARASDFYKALEVLLPDLVLLDVCCRTKTAATLSAASGLTP